jgi:1-aminocyclopropane-1-carboxylate deaminase
MSFPTQNIRTDSLKNLYQPFGVDADVLRLDLVHPVVSGNKWFKLKEYLKEAQELGKKAVITFGGAYSNHIIATAAACQSAGLPSIGIIRGEKSPNLSPTLQQAKELGMQLHFITRAAYKDKELPSEVWKNLVPEEAYIISEGGYGKLGGKGAATILNHIPTDQYSHIIASVGTGTTLAGLVMAAPTAKLIGISALRGGYDLASSINALLPTQLHHTFELHNDFHFGGYAKHKPELFEFMNNWYQQTSIPSDFVYTGKLFYAVDTMIRNGAFREGSKLLLIHSGGLQGNRSLKEGTLIF